MGATNTLREGVIIPVCNGTQYLTTTIARFLLKRVDTRNETITYNKDRDLLLHWCDADVQQFHLNHPNNLCQMHRDNVTARRQSTRPDDTITLHKRMLDRKRQAAHTPLLTDLGESIDL